MQILQLYIFSKTLRHRMTVSFKIFHNQDSVIMLEAFKLVTDQVNTIYSSWKSHYNAIRKLHLLCIWKFVFLKNIGTRFSYNVYIPINIVNIPLYYCTQKSLLVNKINIFKLDFYLCSSSHLNEHVLYLVFQKLTSPNTEGLNVICISYTLYPRMNSTIVFGEILF